jgi:L-2-hydroxyglutarate oxidase LhgO
VEAVDAVVIGAGVIGLALGRALSLRGLETVVLERAHAVGTETSSRNSEVIHAGLYYPTGSNKARLCVAGRERLYGYCESHGVAYRRCGKLLVATDESHWPDLRRLHAQAVANGVRDAEWLSGEQARAMEPALVATAALWSPSTGIIDSHGLMLALQGDLERLGGAVALRAPVVSVTSNAHGHVLQIGGDAPMELAAKWVVNAAGLWAPGLAADMKLRNVPTAGYAKGNYFSLAAPAPFSRLIYPLPQAAGLGVHLTLDLGGQARFGPDVEWISPVTPADIDYRVDPARADGFAQAIRRYWPGLPDGALQPAYSGVRPKISGGQDFALHGPREHGVAGLVNLFGIESPGLTACLAIADEVMGRLGFTDFETRSTPVRTEPVEVPREG